MWLPMLIAVVTGLNCLELIQYTWEKKADITDVDVCDLLPKPVTKAPDGTEPSLIQCLDFAASQKRTYVVYTGTSGECVIPDNKTLGNLQGELFKSTYLEFDNQSQTIEDCSEARVSGVYRISSDQMGEFDVYCDVDTDCGPWTVIQRRYSGDLDFQKNWYDYKKGFGDLLGEFWIGNDIIHTLTLTECRLMIQIEAWNGSIAIIEYAQFQVANETMNYKLLVSDSTGNVSDSFTKNNGMEFTTFDMDNDEWHDGNCAATRLYGGWWFRGCSLVNLNGKYVIENGDDASNAMKWYDFFGNDRHVPLKKSKLMLKKKSLN